MTKTEVFNNISRAFHKAGFQLKKHSPEILVAVGVVGTVTSAVLACKATTKVSAVLEKASKDVEGVHSVLENPELQKAYVAEYGEEYTVEESKKDLAIIYAKTGLEFVKLYAPAVILGAASISCFLVSHNILRKRNLALAAAYATERLGFKEYRDRLIDRFGKDLDRELKYNIKSEEIEEEVVNEDGMVSKVKTTVNYADPNYSSDYARFFDEYCLGWTKSAEHNYIFVKHVQNWANDKLKAEGRLFLNDVYEALGIPKTKAGQVVGWIYDEKNPIGDNYVDFGLLNVYDERARDFVNGRERSILLDFNVDGNVWELMS